ncbi:copper resistance protein NlpE [Petrimonas sp.]|uniref:copper resistance protein NlpE n=1 Tax=Petrimonas sp. TaxID=2023866 RepID=UPI003F50F7C0
MKKLSILLVALVSIALISCNNAKQKKTETPDMHTSEMALDYHGVYEGTLPCADCEGIKTKLTINDDNTFVLNSEYLGEENATFEDKGTYFIENGEILVTQEEDGEQKYYKLQEGSLAQLDANKKPVEGEMAPFYVLTKVK